MKQFKNILYLAAPPEHGVCALNRVATLAENNQATLTVLWVSDVPSSERTTRLPFEVETQLTPWRGRIKIETRTKTGTPFVEAIREVLGNGHDLLVKCAGDGAGPPDQRLGTDDFNLLRQCPCPLWLCKANSPAQYRCILAAVDPDDAYPADELNTRDELNLQVLELGASLALSEFAELHVVHVWNALGETAMRGAFLMTPEEQIRNYLNAEQLRRTGLLGRLMERAAERLGTSTMEYLKPIRHLPKGWPRDEIPALVERVGADLIVLGTVARTGIPGLLMGNTAEILLRRLTCSVLAVKPAGFVSPVMP